MSKRYPWYRFYSETLSDRKIRRITRVCELPKMLVLGAWATLMSLANDSPVRGTLLFTDDLPMTRDEIQDEMELDGEMFDTLMQAFQDHEMLHCEDGRYVVTNFLKRNFKSDHDAAQRVARYRARKNNVTPDSTVTPQGNVTETLLKRYSNAPDTETETDTETEKTPVADAPEFPTLAQNEPSILENTDPLEMAAECAKRNDGDKSWTVPEEAGGKDLFEFKPFLGFCVLINAPPEQIPDKKKTQWTRQLHKVADEWHATPDELYQAIRAIPESEHHWRRFTSPYQEGFIETVGVMLMRVKADLPLDAGGDQTSGETGPPDIFAPSEAARLAIEAVRRREHDGNR